MGFQVKIVTSCFGDRIKEIGLTEDLPVQHLIPTIVLDNTNYTTVGTKTNHVANQFRHKLQVKKHRSVEAVIICASPLFFSLLQTESWLQVSTSEGKEFISLGDHSFKP